MRRDGPLLCLVTDRKRLVPSDQGDSAAACRRLIQLIGDAVDAGIDIIHVRELDLDTRTLVSLVHSVANVARGSATRVVVNDRLDIAISCGVAGVHLRFDSISPAAARSIAPPGFLIGRSVHGLEEAMEAAAGADYLVAGTVFPTSSKPPGHPLLGTDGLAAISRAVPIPVLAIGGVTLDRAEEVARSGAAGVAAIGLFLSAETTIARVAAGIRAAFDRVRTAS